MEFRIVIHHLWTWVKFNEFELSWWATTTSLNLNHLFNLKDSGRVWNKLEPVVGGSATPQFIRFLIIYFVVINKVYLAFSIGSTCSRTGILTLILYTSLAQGTIRTKQRFSLVFLQFLRVWTINTRIRYYGLKCKKFLWSLALITFSKIWVLATNVIPNVAVFFKFWIRC